MKIFFAITSAIVDHDYINIKRKFVTDSLTLQKVQIKSCTTSNASTFQYKTPTLQVLGGAL